MSNRPTALSVRRDCCMRWRSAAKSAFHFLNALRPLITALKSPTLRCNISICNAAT